MVSYRKNSDRLPRLTRHKASGQGVVRLNGKDVYCGPFGTMECKARYLRAIADWEAHGRKPAPEAQPEPLERPDDLTINELLLAYREFAATYYVKRGEPTTEQRDIELSIKPLRILFGHAIAAEFKPAQLKAIRQAYIDADLCRNEVNKRTRRIIRLFGWAVEEGLIPSAVHWGLKTVKGIRKGRAGVRESRKVEPVPGAVVEATLPFLSPQLRAMVELQRLTGMRPQEVCLMRTADLDTSGTVWVYTPGRHKREHHEKPRLIHLRPQAQAIVKPWLRPDMMAYLFSPAEAMERRREEMRRNRKTPVPPSQRNRKKAKPKRTPGDHYEVSSYDHAVAKACDKAFPHATLSKIAPGALTDGQRAELDAWQKAHRWHPNVAVHTLIDVCQRMRPSN
jgi:integrase